MTAAEKIAAVQEAPVGELAVVRGVDPMKILR